MKGAATGHCLGRPSLLFALTNRALARRFCSMKTTTTVPDQAARLIGVYEELRRIHGRARSASEACEDLKNWRHVQLMLSNKLLALRRRLQAGRAVRA